MVRPGGLTTVSLPVTRTAGMSLVGMPFKSKLLPEARKAAWRLPFRPVGTVLPAVSVIDSIRPRSGPIDPFLPCAAGLRARRAEGDGESPARYSAVQYAVRVR